VKRQNAKNRNSLQEKGAHAPHLLLQLFNLEESNWVSQQQQFARRTQPRRLTSFLYFDTHTHTQKINRSNPTNRRGDPFCCREWERTLPDILIFFETLALILLDYIHHFIFIRFPTPFTASFFPPFFQSVFLTTLKSWHGGSCLSRSLYQHSRHLSLPTVLHLATQPRNVLHPFLAVHVLPLCFRINANMQSMASAVCPNYQRCCHMLTFP